MSLPVSVRGSSFQKNTRSGVLLERGSPRTLVQGLADAGAFGRDLRAGDPDASAFAGDAPEHRDRQGRLSRGIRVNTIAPGPFDTPMLVRLREDIRQELPNSIPWPKRLGDADDYGHMALSLIGNEYVGGHVVRLDGAIRKAPR